MLLVLVALGLTVASVEANVQNEKKNHLCFRYISF